jgi:hypothetical protein
MIDAIKTIKLKQNKEKRGNLENTFNGRMIENIEIWTHISKGFS